MIDLALSPLLWDTLTREYWGQWDPLIMAQLAALGLRTDCYQPKFYKAPASSDEVIPANGTAQYGLTITPGSLIYGFYLPADPATSLPPQFNVQITDENLKNNGKPYQLWDEPVPSIFLANYKPSFLAADPALYPTGQIACFPSLLSCPHPVTGNGLFRLEFWQGPTSVRIELVVGVLEVRGCQ